MLTLTIFNFILLVIIAALLFLVKKTVKSEKMQNSLLLISALVTIIFHYSTFIFRFITGGEAIAYLKETPNLILPIYPCNVVMWSCLILPFIKNESSKLKRLLVDYIFWFGIFSTLVGMFANVDFIMNPTLKDYEITKSIVAHATLLFNVLLLLVFGKVRIDMWQNLKNMFISVVIMYVIGLYCNLIFKVLVSVEAAYDVNSMFIIHSPFDGAAFLRYPLIAAVAMLLYFALFTVCDLIKNKKGERWFDKALTAIKSKTNKS
ncbi:MAG: YwaF family protein [Clostridia bacterium]|nr:YwaF family protein [Clostridia bacterium]